MVINPFRGMCFCSEIEEDCVLWGTFSLSGEMKTECIQSNIVVVMRTDCLYMTIYYMTCYIKTCVLDKISVQINSSDNNHSIFISRLGFV